MNAVYLMNQIHYEHIKLLLVTSRGIVTSQVTVFLHCYMCTITVSSLEIKALNKATRKQGLYALQRGYCTNADSLGQWRKSYHDITTKTSCVKYT